MKPWIQKAWSDIIAKVLIMCHQAARAVRTERMLKYVEVRAPTLVSHVRALTDKEDLVEEVVSTPCTYPVSRQSGTKFPKKPEDRQHETERQYRNQCAPSLAFAAVFARSGRGTFPCAMA